MYNSKQIYSQLRFLHHIKVSAVEDLWQDGYLGFQQHLDEMANPYPLGSQAHQHWQDGWWAGFYGEKPLFNLAAEVTQIAKGPAANQTHWSWWKSYKRKIFEVISAILLALAGFQALDIMI